ncbi:DUF423 domain-containing protein [Oceaniserpentilla sp. 4NH20-0058]|uniref:DUF423 domain-containing protein n=1 Tax=Oceaniserpentilla sp. 4NH20-0058 TaxID=3127660 RepID=UPI00334114EC
MISRIVTSQNVIVIAATLGFLSVAIGAFAAHSLKHVLNHQALLWVDTGVKYQMFHGGIMLILGFALKQWPNWKLIQWAALSFLVGILLFSGSLYIMAATQIKALGMITPIGGLAMLVGWLCLLLGALKQPE